MLVSIVVPIYNAENYLKKCLDSIINQSYSNIEIILVDDGSSDNSGLICDEYSKLDTRVKVVHKNNGGVSKARNSGIDIASGEYITFIDSDDYVAKDYILNLYKKNNDNYDLVVENAIDFDDSSFYSHRKVNNDIILSCSDFLKEVLKEELISSVCWGKLFKTEIVKIVKFNINYRIAEDLDFLVNYIDKCNGNIKIIDNLDYFYFLSPGSAIRSGYNEKWEDEFEICEKIIDKFNTNELYVYAIKRFIRINVTCLVNFKLDSTEKNRLKNNIRRYSETFFKSNLISLKDKVKVFTALYFCSVIYFIKKGR